MLFFDREYKTRLLLIMVVLPLFFLMGFSSSVIAQSITLTVASGNGANGNTTNMSGSSFTPGVISANSITFSGYATTHSAITVDGSGNFPSTLLTLPNLPNGDQSIVVQGQVFTGKYTVFRAITLSPDRGSGKSGESFLLSGTGFADSTINSSTITVGGLITTHFTFTPSQGAFSNRNIILPALGTGYHDVVAQGETFVGRYRVSNITVTPDNGDGTSGNTISLDGLSFAPNDTIPANSVTVGGQATTHGAISTDGSGNFTGAVITLPALSSGLHSLVIDGITFQKVYRVPDISVSPSSDNGANNNTINVSGSGFSPSSTIPANSITVGGYATTHAGRSVNFNGDFNSVTVTLPALPYGAHDIVVDSTTFSGKYSVYRELTVNPDNGDGTAGNTTDLSGTGFQDVLIPANSITVNGLSTTHGAVTPANGTFSLLGVSLPALGTGSHNVVVQGQTFTYAYRVPGVTLSSYNGTGASGETFSISGVGFAPGSISSNSITVGGRATSHSSRTVNADGTFSSVTVTLPTLAQGTHDVVVQGVTFANLYTVSSEIYVSPGSDTGASGNHVFISGSGFPASQSIPANSITVGGYATTHSAKTATANGDFSSIDVTLPAMVKGTHDVVVAGKTFTNYYTVYADISLTVTSGNGVTGETTTISGTGFTPGAIAANSITFAGFAVTHGGITVAADGTLPATLLTLPYLPRGTLDVVVDDVDPGVETFSNAFTVTPAVTISSTSGNGNNGNTTTITVGTGFSPGTISANSITFRRPSDSSHTATHAAITVLADGRISGTIPLTLPYLPGGSLTMRIQSRDFSGAYTVTADTISLSPNNGTGLNTDTTDLSGFGFVPYSISSSSITIDGVSISHGTISVNSDGRINTSDPDHTLTLPYLSNGVKNMVIQGITFPNVFTVNRGMSANPSSGNGLAGNTTTLTMSGFTASSTIPANTMTINGSTITHGTINFPSNGYMGSVVVTLPSLPLGSHTIVAQGDNFVGVYTVTSDLFVTPDHGYGYQGNTLTLSGTGFVPGVIAANSITFNGVAGTHSAITIPGSGIMPNTTVSLPWLSMGDVTIVAQGNTFNGLYSATPAVYTQPSMGVRDAGTVLSIYGFGFPPGTIPANSMLLKKQSTGETTALTHAAITVGSNGFIPPQSVTVGAYLPWGWHALVVSYGANNLQFDYQYGAGITSSAVPAISAIGLSLLVLLMSGLLLAFGSSRRKKKALPIISKE